MLTETRPEPLRSRALGSGIAHGFFTRDGGVSDGIYRGLNVGLGSADDPESVAENRRRVAVSLGVEPAMLACPHQVHSPDVIAVDAPFSGKRPKADGIVTATPGLAIGVLTADCGPVLFCDAEARIVGAAHAGWKGALTGVLENTIAAMEALGARKEHIVAVLGPAISQASYEVGPEFVDRLLDAASDNDRWFVPSPRTGHAMFDLAGYILARLTAAGVTASSLDLCTYGDEERFFSYRRASHRGEADYGRQISAIALEFN
ncbi:MAG: peptidoglycan editing factor PgeF [Rhizobiaceae bacterium]